jgi:hypothetical protein
MNQGQMNPMMPGPFGTQPGPFGSTYGKPFWFNDHLSPHKTC